MSWTRRVAALAVVVVGLIGLGPAAFGAARVAPTLDRDSARPNTDVVLQMEVPPKPGTRNTIVIVTVPVGYATVRCLAAGDWSCTVGEGGAGQPETITWAPRAGLAKAEGIESFSFVVHSAGAAGTVAFPVDQFTDQGGETLWNGAPDAANAAPTLTVSPTGEAEVAPPTTDSAAAPLPSQNGAVVAKKKDRNMTPLYILIVLWLAILITVVMDVGAKPKHVESHASDHH